MPPIETSAACPLGASFDGSGADFALCSGVADGVELCLVGTSGEETRGPLTEMRARLPVVALGQRPGCRGQGARPEPGLASRFDKFLFAPYAKVSDHNGPANSPSAENRDHAMTEAVAHPTKFGWSGDVPGPRTQRNKTMTETHPEVPKKLRDTHAGMARPAVLDDLVGLAAGELVRQHQLMHDGTDDTRPWHCETEGSTDDAAVLELRHRQRRSLHAALFLSQGVPLLLSIHPLTRVTGSLAKANTDLLAFARNVVAVGALAPRSRGSPWTDSR